MSAEPTIRGGSTGDEHLSSEITPPRFSRSGYRSRLPEKGLGRSCEGGGVHSLALDYLCTPLRGAMENRFGAQSSPFDPAVGTAAFGATRTLVHVSAIGRNCPLNGHSGRLR